MWIWFSYFFAVETAERWLGFAERGGHEDNKLLHKGRVLKARTEGGFWEIQPLDERESKAAIAGMAHAAGEARLVFDSRESFSPSTHPSVSLCVSVLVCCPARRVPLLLICTTTYALLVLAFLLACITPGSTAAILLPTVRCYSWTGLG